MKHLKLAVFLCITATLQACAYSRTFEQSNPDGSKSRYDFVHDVDLMGPNTVVVRVHDCTEVEGSKNCVTREPQVGHGNGVLEQLAAPGAMVGAAVLWPEDSITATGGSAVGGNATSSSSSGAVSISGATSSSGSPKHGK